MDEDDIIAMSPWLQIFFTLALFVHILARPKNGNNPSGLKTDVGNHYEEGDEEIDLGDIEAVTSTRRSKLLLNPKTVLTQAIERTLFEMSVEDLNSEVTHLSFQRPVKSHALLLY